MAGDEFSIGDRVLYYDRGAVVKDIDKDMCLVEFEDNRTRVWVSCRKLRHKS